MVPFRQVDLMPVMHIGPRAGTLVARLSPLFIILLLGSHFIVLILASNGIYVRATFLCLINSTDRYPLPPRRRRAIAPENADADRRRAIRGCDCAYQTVIAMEPTNDSAYAKMTKPLILLRKYDDAVKAARRAVQLNDQRPENLAALAEALDWHGDFVEAIDFALRATEINPNYALGYAYAAEIYADLNRPDRALAAAQKAVQLDDNSAEAHRN
jgi:tetratricopeptide (TPR) repeat protein